MMPPFNPKPTGAAMPLSSVHRLIASLIGLVFSFAVLPSAHAQTNTTTTGKATPQTPPPLVEPAAIQKDGDTVKLPGLVIHATQQPYIEATGKVVLDEGILEFIAVEKEGRTYESLLALDCKPSALQFALLLIGCEPSPEPRTVQPGGKIGDRLAIDIEWLVDGKPKRVPVEELLVDRKTTKPPTDLAWYFTGSFFTTTFANENKFYADIDQSLIATVWMTGVLINLGNNFGNPYQGEAEGFEVNAKRVPPKDTPIKLIFRKHPGK
jgi:hypothetical protein